MDRDREVLAKRLDGERASREELQGELSKLQRQTQALENVEEMLFKERAQRQRAERSIVELARSLGTLKAALLHAGLPVPPEARPSSALQLTVQVRQPPTAALNALSYVCSSLTAPRTAGCRLFGSEETCTRSSASACAGGDYIAPCSSLCAVFRAVRCPLPYSGNFSCPKRRQRCFCVWNRSERAGRPVLRVRLRCRRRQHGVRRQQFRCR